MKLSQIKAELRDGQYAWPGGYPKFFVMSDGEALSFDDVRAEWRCIVSAHLSNDTRSGWHIAGVDINWEDSELVSAHSGKRIESAYGEEESDNA